MSDRIRACRDVGLKGIAALLVLHAAGASAADPSGERLAHLVGCVNCHHQTPKEIINAPPLAIVQAYSLQEFSRLMKTGVTRTGRDLLALSSIMGIVAKEQFSHFSEAEISVVYEFLRNDWTAEDAAREEAKIPLLYRAEMGGDQ